MTIWFAGQAVPIASVCIAGNLATCSVSCRLYASGVDTRRWVDLMGLELPLRIERTGLGTKRLHAVLESWDTDGRLEFKCRYREEAAA